LNFADGKKGQENGDQRKEMIGGIRQAIAGIIEQV